MDNATLEKLAKQLKPGEPFQITFISPIDSTKEFREMSKGWTIGKLTGVTTVTGMKYSELDDVKKAREEREAAVAAGTAKPVQHRESPYTTVIPNTLVEGKKNGLYYLNLYPTVMWKNSFSQYCLFNENGEVEEQYDSWEDIRDYVSQGWVNKHTAPSDGKPFKLQPIIQKPADRIYDIMVGGFGEGLQEANQPINEVTSKDVEEVEQKEKDLYYQLDNDYLKDAKKTLSDMREYVETCKKESQGQKDSWFYIGSMENALIRAEREYSSYIGESLNEAKNPWEVDRENTSDMDMDDEYNAHKSYYDKIISTQNQVDELEKKCRENVKNELRNFARESGKVFGFTQEEADAFFDENILDNDSLSKYDTSFKSVEDFLTEVFNKLGAFYEDASDYNAKLASERASRGM